jgi:hemolysin activation/secretion protein
MMAKTSHRMLRGLQLPRPLTLAMLVSGVIGGLTINPLYAQQAPTAGSILQSNKEPIAEPKPGPEIGIPPAPAPKPLKADPGLKVKVSAFVIHGNTVFSEATLLPLISAQIGKELDFDALSEAANSVAVYYRSKGYFLAQAYLPAQQIKNGVVEITVLEGRVGEVKLNPDNKEWKLRLRESKARAILEAIQPGDIINERSLERGLLLLNDVPGAIVKSTLTPGTQVGTADTVVELSEDGKLVSGSAKLDNWGSRYTGEYRLGADLNINNPSGYGDVLSVNGLTSQRNGSPMGRLSYVVPLGSMGTKLGLSYSKLDYTLGKDFTYLLAHGKAEVGSAYVLHPFVRSRNFNVVGVLGVNKKKMQDLIDYQNSTDTKSLRAYNIGFSGDLSDNVFGGSLNTFSLTFSGGKVDFQTPIKFQDDQNSSVGYHTSGSYTKANYSYQRLQALVRNVSLYVALDGQTASKDLTSSEQYSLGGPSAVRAYPVGEALCDEGLVTNAELRWNIPQTNFMVNSFVDYGHALLHKTPLASDVSKGTSNYRNLVGYGLGVNYGKPENYLLRTSLAWRGNREANDPLADKSGSGSRLWLQFTKWF